jgi:hypothetical protein
MSNGQSLWGTTHAPLDRDEVLSKKVRVQLNNGEILNGHVVGVADDGVTLSLSSQGSAIDQMRTSRTFVSWVDVHSLGVVGVNSGRTIGVGVLVAISVYLVISVAHAYGSMAGN